VTVIADKNGVTQIDCLGYADRETQRPMTADTLFWVASQTKQITATAVMMLVETGKISLDAPVTDYLPELKNLKVIATKDDQKTVLVPPEKPITLRMCLSHTAGFPFLSPFQERHHIDALPVSSAVTTYAMTPLLSQPTTNYLYSNVGINVAAAVVEKVAGMPFEQFLQQRLFDPLEMTETTFFPTAEQLTRLAHPYRWDNENAKLVVTKIGFLSYPLDKKNRYPEGGGGLFSTPKEWVKIYQLFANEGTLNSKKILTPESVKEIRSKQTGSLSANYGFGIQMGGDWIGHDGSHGTSSRFNHQTGNIAEYFIQQEGLPKAGEAQQKFMKIATAR
jgi:CubicO group peptidase (beta-lactamase class C family)